LVSSLNGPVVLRPARRKGDVSFFLSFLSTWGRTELLEKWDRDGRD